MKAAITGAHGTVGSALRRQLSVQGITSLPWDRHQLTPLDEPTTRNWLEQQRPDLFFHLALATEPTPGLARSQINIDWPEQLATLCRELDIRFLYTSTAMVFTPENPGPYTTDREPDAREGYGWEKLQGERRVQIANPHAKVIRLGWQIGEQPGSNNMIDYFETQQREHGAVRASTRWLPACSLLTDTATALNNIALDSDREGSIFHLDSNQGWNFFEIASALNQLHGERWRIEPSEDFIYDQRLLDHHLRAPILSKKIPALPKLSPKNL